MSSTDTRHMVWSIYLLKADGDSSEYIGSFKNQPRYTSVAANLNERFRLHKRDAEKHPNRKVCAHFNHFSWNPTVVKISLLEEVNAIERFGPGLSLEQYRKHVLKIEGSYIASRKPVLNTELAGSGKGTEWRTAKVSCPHCNKTLSRCSLKGHIETIHSNTQSDPNRGFAICPQCQTRLRKDSMRRHVALFHNQNA